MCFGSERTVKAAEAPPAPEATPEAVIAPEETTTASNDRKQKKAKATGLDAYRTDLGITDKGSGINVPR